MMMSVESSIVKTDKKFDIFSGDGIVTVTVSNLTIKQKDKIYESIEERVKERKRKEFIAISKLMDQKERIKFLIESASSNKVTVEEIIEESQTVNEIANILSVACKDKIDWNSILKQEECIPQTLKCYYWALNIDVPDDVEDTKSDNTGNEDKEGFFTNQDIPQNQK
jgi:hypothetical protein